MGRHAGHKVAIRNRVHKDKSKYARRDKWATFIENEHHKDDREVVTIHDDYEDAVADARQIALDMDGSYPHTTWRQSNHTEDTMKKYKAIWYFVYNQTPPVELCSTYRWNAIVNHFRKFGIITE